MRTLLVKDGDLVVGPAGFLTASGTARVHQDLNHAVQEPYGSDRFHPRWGSVLGEYVGGVIDEEVHLLIRSEIVRVVSNYIVMHQEVVKRDSSAGRKQRYNTGEMVSDVREIRIYQPMRNPTQLLVHAKAITLTGDQVTVLTQIGG